MRLLVIQCVLVQGMVLPVTRSFYPNCHKWFLTLLRPKHISPSFSTSFRARVVLLFYICIASGSTEIRSQDKEEHPSCLHDPNWQCSIICKISKHLNSCLLKQWLLHLLVYFSLLFPDQRSSLHNSPGPKAWRPLQYHWLFQPNKGLAAGPAGASYSK